MSGNIYLEVLLSLGDEALTNDDSAALLKVFHTGKLSVSVIHLYFLSYRANRKDDISNNADQQSTFSTPKSEVFLNYNHRTVLILFYFEIATRRSLDYDDDHDTDREYDTPPISMIIITTSLVEATFRILFYFL